MILFGSLMLFIAVSVMAIAGISKVTGFEFWELMQHVRTLLIGPVLVIIIWVIEKLEVPLPFRFENTWPFILGAFWIGIHTLIAMKAQVDLSGLYYDGYPEDWLELPWYAGKACAVIVFAVLVTLGYVVRSKNNRHHW